MPKIHLTTPIAAPIARVFDLARSIDLHRITSTETDERAIGGRTSGLIKLHETVTWRAKHLGIYQNLTSIITEMERPYLFTDEMVKGAFKSIKHVHTFKERDGITEMVDEFNYESPLGILGYAADYIFLTNYMTAFLTQRNQKIKKYAEGDEWIKILNIHS